jgi:hypothetical protein
MPAQQNLGHEISLLRRIVQNLAKRPVRPGPIRYDLLRAEGLGRARLGPNALVGILSAGIEPFTQLSERLFSTSAKVQRGTTFKEFQDEFFSALLSDYLERDPRSIGGADVLVLEARLADWFAKRAGTQTVFVPCMISPWRSPRFSIGPVSFIFLQDVPTSEYLPRGDSPAEATFYGVTNLLDAMRKERAHWLAIVDVEGCDKPRAQQIADLAVDMAIVALQLAAPYLGTKNMSRLAARRGPGMQLTLTLSDGQYSGGWSNLEPGITIGDGTLGKIVDETAPVITAVGNRVRSFATGTFRLPRLEQAWCDAAYWLHEGLAEPLDSIAVAKLETAIEVLLHAESASGSESRIVAALETFYGLEANDPIAPNTETTVKEFAHGFVRDRSRVLHGTWSTLNATLAASRDSLENFAVTLARASAVEIDAYIQSLSPTDDTESFLTWVKSRQRSPAGQ